MDFKKTHNSVPHQLSLDPSGIDICGNGHVNIDMNASKIAIECGTIDISGTQIAIECETIDISGTVKMDDTQVQRTWFGPDGRGGEVISGGGWTMLKNLPPKTGIGFPETVGETGVFMEDKGIERLDSVFSRPISALDFEPNELLFTTITSDLVRVWWILDYNYIVPGSTSAGNRDKWQTSAHNSSWVISQEVIKQSSPNVSHANWCEKPQAQEFFESTVYFHGGTLNPSTWMQMDGPTTGTASSALQFSVYRPNMPLSHFSSSVTDANHWLSYYQGMTILVRNSTNIATNPAQYPTIIKKEYDNLHISAPLSIYPEGNNELSKKGNEHLIDNLVADSYLGNTGVTGGQGTILDGRGGWYLVRQMYNFASGHSHTIFDNFYFRLSQGIYSDNPASGTYYTRMVSDYDYDEILFYSDLYHIWVIWDRAVLEALSTTNISNYGSRTIVKQSSATMGSSLMFTWARDNQSAALGIDPQPDYSYPDGGSHSGPTTSSISSMAPLERFTWSEGPPDAHINISLTSFYVRRADGQPVRKKNKVKVDADGNLDVGGTITCPRFSSGAPGTWFGSDALGGFVNSDSGTFSVTNNTNFSNYPPEHETNQIAFKADTYNRYGGKSIDTCAKISVIRQDQTGPNSGAGWPMLATSLAFSSGTGEIVNGAYVQKTREQMRITYNGYVGIGTPAPAATLDVNGSFKAGSVVTPQLMTGGGLMHRSNNDFHEFIRLDRPGYQPGGGNSINGTPRASFQIGGNGDYYAPACLNIQMGGTQNFILHTNGHLYLPYGVVQTSDMRIKTNISLVDDNEALDIILKLETKKYDYIDYDNKKEHRTIGFIAQEVKAVLPNAVLIDTNIIPSDQKFLLDLKWSSDICGNNILTIDDINFENNNTGKCQFHISEEIVQEKPMDVELISCILDDNGNKTNQFKFAKKYKTVYLFGKEVNDFHRLKKDVIFALHHSAIQELSRKNDRSDAKVVILNADNATLKEQMAVMQAQAATMQTQLAVMLADIAALKNS